jgi:hypothetical protein
MTGTNNGRTFYNQADGFTSNYGIAQHAGQRATFFDSPQLDVFVGNTSSSSLSSDNGQGNLAIFNEAQGFAQVEAFSFVGGTDDAYVYDPVVNSVVVGFHRIV